jgi:hypothetical protein
MEASQHSLLAACFTLHSINATLAVVPQRGAGMWIFFTSLNNRDLGKIKVNPLYTLPHLNIRIYETLI